VFLLGVLLRNEYVLALDSAIRGHQNTKEIYSASAVTLFTNYKLDTCYYVVVFVSCVVNKVTATVYIYTRWFKYDRDKYGLFTQISPSHI
jgi:hypothetical protein